METDYFEPVFQQSTIMVCLASVCLLVNLVGGYGNWWYYRYGTDARRTLLRRSVEGLSRATVIYLILIQSVDILRYIYGPFNVIFCTLHLALKNAMNIIIALTHVNYTLSKYIYSCWKDDFLEIQEEFLYGFANIWIFLVGIISQSVYVYLPGKQPVSFYICCGQAPDPALDETKIKVNYSTLMIDLLAMALHFWVTIKLTLLKIKLDRSVLKFDLSLLKTYKGNIYEYLFGTIFTFWYTYIITKLNSIRVAQVNDYPNYLFVHAIYIIFPTLLVFSITIVYYIQNKQIIEVLKEELVIMFESLLSTLRSLF